MRRIGAWMTRCCSAHIGVEREVFGNFVCIGLVLFYALTALWNVEYVLQDRLNNGEAQLQRWQSTLAVSA